MSLTNRLNITRKLFLPKPRHSACYDKGMWLFGRTLRTSDNEDRKRWFHKVTEKIKDCYFLEETVVPYNSVGLSHVQENRAC